MSKLHIMRLHIIFKDGKVKGAVLPRYTHNNEVYASDTADYRNTIANALDILNPQVFVEFYNRGLGTFDKTKSYEWPGTFEKVYLCSGTFFKLILPSIAEKVMLVDDLPDVKRLVDKISTENAQPEQIHPCSCTSYNGKQCYNCLNGAHEICEAKIKCVQKNSEQVGLPIVVINSESPEADGANELDLIQELTEALTVAIENIKDRNDAQYYEDFISSLTSAVSKSKEFQQLKKKVWRVGPQAKSNNQTINSIRNR